MDNTYMYIIYQLYYTIIYVIIVRQIAENK